MMRRLVAPAALAALLSPLPAIAAGGMQETQAGDRPDHSAGARSENQPENRPEPRPEMRPANRPESRPENRPGSQPDGKADRTQAILKSADESRGNVRGIAWQVEIESTQDERVLDTLLYDIKARSFNVAGTSMAPPKYRGNKILMLGPSMWFYKPGLSKPVPISQRQKLMGDASYGDIASTNYAGDYDATPLPDEKVNDEACYVYDLKARTDKVTYERVRYWVSKAREVGVKAEYYTVSGKKFKSATMDYGNRVNVDGKARPFLSRIALRGELLNGAVTYLTVRQPRIAPLPDHVFDLNLFMR